MPEEKSLLYEIMAQWICGPCIESGCPCEGFPERVRHKVEGCNCADGIANLIAKHVPERKDLWKR